MRAADSRWPHLAGRRNHSYADYYRDVAKRWLRCWLGPTTIIDPVGDLMIPPTFSIARKRLLLRGGGGEIGFAAGPAESVVAMAFYDRDLGLGLAHYHASTHRALEKGERDFDQAWRLESYGGVLPMGIWARGHLFVYNPLGLSAGALHALRQLAREVRDGAEIAAHIGSEMAPTRPLPPFVSLATGRAEVAFRPV
jgi:hypothetical protein